jgi:hypothetical protein
MTTKYEAGLQEHEPRRVTGVKGLNSKPFERRFRSAAAMGRWLEKEAGNVEIYAVEREQ